MKKLNLKNENSWQIGDNNDIPDFLFIFSYSKQ